MLVGFDVVDVCIVELVEFGDFVIIVDILLVVVVFDKGVYVFDLCGNWFSCENIEECLLMCVMMD